MDPEEPPSRSFLNHLTLRQIFVSFVILFPFVFFIINYLGHNEFRSDWKGMHMGSLTSSGFRAPLPEVWNIQRGQLNGSAHSEGLQVMQLLSHRLSSETLDFEISSFLGIHASYQAPRDAFAGFLIGDYTPADPAISIDNEEDKAFMFVLGRDGHLRIYRAGNDLTLVAADSASQVRMDLARRIQLKMKAEYKDSGYHIHIRAILPKGRVLSQIELTNIPASNLSGPVSLVYFNGKDPELPVENSNQFSGPGSKEFQPGWWFNDWRITGNKLYMNSSISQ